MLVVLVFAEWLLPPSCKVGFWLGKTERAIGEVSWQSVFPLRLVLLEYVSWVMGEKNPK